MRPTLMLALGAMILGAASASGSPTPEVERVALVELTVRYTLTLTNRSTDWLHGAEVRVFAPVTRSSSQRALTNTADTAYEIVVDDLGNRVLRFEIDLAPQAVRTIGIEGRVAFRAEPEPIQVEDAAHWLESSRYVEVDAPEVVAAARRLADGSPAEVAANALAFVAEHVEKEGYISEERGARAALARGSGDCTEAMYLFVALLRVRGVPARGVSGFVLRGNTTLRASDLHDWAEYHDGTTWRVADPYRGVLHPRPEHYLAMLILDHKPSPLLRGMRRFATDNPSLVIRVD